MSHYHISNCGNDIILIVNLKLNCIFTVKSGEMDMSVRFWFRLFTAHTCIIKLNSFLIMITFTVTIVLCLMYLFYVVGHCLYDKLNKIICNQHSDFCSVTYIWCNLYKLYLTLLYIIVGIMKTYCPYNLE